MSNTSESWQPSSHNSCILWSCIARNGTIVVDAGHDPYNGIVAQTAKELLCRPVTPGYEFHRSKQQQQQNNSNSSNNKLQEKKSIKASLYKCMRQPRSQLSSHPEQPQHDSISNISLPPPPSVRGIKFHVFEPMECDDEEYNHMVDNDITGTTDNSNKKNEDEYSNFRIWVFGAVYDSSRISQTEVQAFLEKIAELTIILRETDEWKNCPILGIQNEFGPILEQRMIEIIPHDPKVIAVIENLDYTRQVIERNIELILDRGNRIDSLAEDATRLQDLSNQFKKRSRDLKRFQLMQNAKYGIILGTAVTVGVGILVVPPLVALL